MTLDEMKRRYDALQERIRKLEAEHAAIVARGEPVPTRITLYLAEDRISAEEFRMWGNRELTALIREATKNDEKSLSISQHRIAHSVGNHA